MKKKTVFFCNQCGYESSGWLGKCPACGEWNSFVEEKISKTTNNKEKRKTNNKAVCIDEVESDERQRKKTGINELDRVLGGGFVKGALILIGGEPGIGKSTMLLQIINKSRHDKILYVSGEESLEQIKLRANRLAVKSNKLYLYSETNLNDIEEMVDKEKPDFLMIDSIQTIYSDELSSAPGTVSQIRQATSQMMKIAKEQGITVLIVGHVTKEGAIAGPRVLEHMVDTVLYFEGDRNMSYRILRAVKNRFGSTNEIGVFEMTKDGLEEVQNPSQALLEGRDKDASGSIVVSTMEGTRPMLIEIQALVSDSNFGMPRRTTNGVDSNKIALLLAVLEKKVGLRISGLDAYVNVLGGIKVSEPACDLGLVLALASSFRDKPILHDTIVFGEVGLTGEVRLVSHAEKRINEAARMGFKKCILPKGNVKNINKYDMMLLEVKTVKEALDSL